MRVWTSGDNSELVKVLPIGEQRDGKQRVVMSIPGGEIGAPGREGGVIEASAEVEVTVCLKANKLHPGSADSCTGKPYGYDPHVNARLVLANGADETAGAQVGATQELQCSQRHPVRNHHCVLAIPWSAYEVEAKRLTCAPSCSLNLVMSAWSSGAKAGNKVVIGADSHGPIKQDKGRVNLVAYGTAGPIAGARKITREPVSRSVPIVRDGADDPKFRVAYSQRITDLREGDQFKVDARTVARIGSVSYNVELPTQVIVAKSRKTTKNAAVAVFTEPSSQVSELNGVNCTQRHSAHSNPCVRDKFGVFRISREIDELYVNVVQGAEAKLTTQRWRRSDELVFDPGGGYLKMWRFGG